MYGPDAVTLSTDAKSLACGRAGVGHEALDRGDDRLRVERRAVVELDPLAQLDRVAELVLREHRQRGGEHRDELQLGVVVVEPLAHGPVDRGRRDAPAHRRIEGVGVAALRPTTSVPPYFDRAACARTPGRARPAQAQRPPTGPPRSAVRSSQRSYDEARHSEASVLRSIETSHSRHKGVDGARAHSRRRSICTSRSPAGSARAIALRRRDAGTSEIALAVFGGAHHALRARPDARRIVLDGKVRR